MHFLVLLQPNCSGLTLSAMISGLSFVFPQVILTCLVLTVNWELFFDVSERDRLEVSMQLRISDIIPLPHHMACSEGRGSHEVMTSSPGVGSFCPCG